MGGFDFQQVSKVFMKLPQMSSKEGRRVGAIYIYMDGFPKSQRLVDFKKGRQYSWSFLCSRIFSVNYLFSLQL